MRNRILTLTAAAVVMLCAAASASASPAPAPKTNARGAIEVALGQPVTVTDANGALVLAVSDSRLSADGCQPNSTDPADITKQVFTATIRIGKQTSLRWLWASEVYYVDAAGKVVRNDVISDDNPCRSDTSDNFRELPPNSSATGGVTLDIPRHARIIGYRSALIGPPLTIEWTLPQPVN